MRLSLLLIGLLLGSLLALSQEALPQMTSVDPDSAKAGSVVTAVGANLTKERVTKVYLTDGTKDYPMQITEQADKTLKFKVPDDMKSGRWALMILTGGREPRLVEQPVKLTIE